MRDEAEKRIGHLYPKVKITADMVKERPDLKPYTGKELTVIAWIWARTVKSPNPAFAHVDVPLASTFMLSTKKGKEAYIEPVIEGDSYRFMVKVEPRDPEAAKKGTKLGRGANFKCLLSGTPIAGDYIKAEGRAGRMGARLMAIVAEGEGERVYLPPLPEHEAVARKAVPEWRPETILDGKCRDQMPLYGMNKFGDIFSSRQHVALNTFSELVGEVVEKIKSDVTSNVFFNGKRTNCDLYRPSGASGSNCVFEASEYAEAVALYLAFAVDKGANYWSSLCTWHQTRMGIVSTFGRQALPMVWDFAEANPISSSSGNFMVGIKQAAEMITWFWTDWEGHAGRCYSSVLILTKSYQLIPYYDNICYADLSDFFYVWLRRSLKSFVDLFATPQHLKQKNFVASPTVTAVGAGRDFLLSGMTQAMKILAEQTHPAFPITIYYAFKQSESDRQEGTVSTGWETFLGAVLRAGLSICGTWPIRTEYTGNLKKNMSVLASSVVLVCRPRPADAPTATRREFVAALKAELPPALAHLQRSNIAPVDLAQAAIGPGMAVYTRYARVLDVEGNTLSVREALALVNQILDEVLAEQEGDFDADTRWALAWFEQYGFNEGEYGVAETLSKAKNTSVEGMQEAGIIVSRGGKVRLLKPAELAAGWDPDKDKRLTVWEMVHQLLRALQEGERAAAALTAKLGSRADTARQLAYRLYTLCERKKWAPEGLAYNGLVQSWPEIARLAQGLRESVYQTDLFGGE